MKRILVFFGIIISAFTANAFSEFEGVQKLIDRRVPWLTGKVNIFKIKTNPSDPAFDKFKIHTQSGKLNIEASSISAASMAINYYLKEYCNQSFFLLTDNIKPLKVLPIIEVPIQKTTPFQYRHGNYHCTHNYTQAFWKWDDWQRCIDWYALNGVNLMISLVGNEAIEQQVLRKFGYSDKEIFDLLPSPAYTNWHWLGNIEKEGGPVSQNLIDKQTLLQQQILKRLDELGIEPIMQGFASLVPTNFKQKFPQAKIVDQGYWGGHHRPVYLHTSDTLSVKYGNIWYSTLEKFYGKRKYFSFDLLHEGGFQKEMNIPELVPDLQRSMMQHNPAAVWIVQAWFIQADDYPARDSSNNGNPYPPLLKAALKDHIMVWDIYGENDNIWERRNGYDGLPFIWGTLTYFGGRCGMVGKLDRYKEQIDKARKLYPDQLKGIGTNPEAIENNPVWYDFIYHYAWQEQSIDGFNIDTWLKRYTVYRYGKENASVTKAWELMHQTVYSSFTEVYEGPPVSIFCEEPNYLDSMKGQADGHDWFLAWRSFKRPFYDVNKFEEAAKLFVSSAEKFKESPAYLYDLTDITRQLISNRGNEMFDSIMNAYNRKDLVRFEKYTDQFFLLLDQMEQLCNAHKNFRVHTWINKARQMGDTKLEKEMLVRDAKTLITRWAFNGTPPELNDYAQRQWAGLLNDYYKVRWKKFFENCKLQLQGEASLEISFDQMASDWINSKNDYTSSPEGNTVELADKFINFDYKLVFNDIQFEEEAKQVAYCVEKVNEPINIDANWNKPQWEAIKAVELNYYMGKMPKHKSTIKAKLRYDTANIYVIFKVTDNFVRSRVKDINGPVWEDNTVEFFFAPDTAAPLKYFNLEINCAGVPLMSYNAAANADIKPLAITDIKQIEIAHSFIPVGDEEVIGPITWTLEYKIPLQMLKKYSAITMPSNGVTWKMNLYKIAHKSSNPHYMSWSFVNADGIDMHTPQFFGELKFQ